MCPSQDVFRIMFILKLSPVVKYVAPLFDFLSSLSNAHIRFEYLQKATQFLSYPTIFPRCRLFSVLSSLLHIFSRYILVVHTIVAQMHRAKWCLGTSQSNLISFVFLVFPLFVNQFQSIFEVQKSGCWRLKVSINEEWEFVF